MKQLFLGIRVNGLFITIIEKERNHTADMLAPGTDFNITLYISPPGVGVSNSKKTEIKISAVELLFTQSKVKSRIMKSNNACSDS